MRSRALSSKTHRQASQPSTGSAMIKLGSAEAVHSNRNTRHKQLATRLISTSISRSLKLWIDKHLKRNQSYLACCHCLHWFTKILRWFALNWLRRGVYYLASSSCSAFDKSIIFITNAHMINAIWNIFHGSLKNCKLADDYSPEKIA